MALDLEALLNNRNATATLILPPSYVTGKKDNPFTGKPRPIVGIYTNASFNIAGSNTFSAPIPQSQLDTVNNLNKFASQAGNTGTAVVNRQIVSGLSTIKTWDSSADFKFNLDLTFIAMTSRNVKDTVSGTNNVTLPCIELLSLVYPNADSPSLEAGKKGVAFSYFAPAGYAPPPINDPNKVDENKGLAGTVQIAIGNWLRLRNMICDNVTCSFSREVQKNGTPLTATVSMEFSCYRTFTYKDIIQIFNDKLDVDIASELYSNALAQGGNTVITTGTLGDYFIDKGNTITNGIIEASKKISGTGV